MKEIHADISIIEGPTSIHNEWLRICFIKQTSSTHLAEKEMEEEDGGEEIEERRRTKIKKDEEIT